MWLYVGLCDVFSIITYIWVQLEANICVGLLIGEWSNDPFLVLVFLNDAEQIFIIGWQVNYGYCIIIY